MTYLETAQEWLEQSALLLKASPSTTSISTKYNLPNLSPPRYPPKKTSTKPEKPRPVSTAPPPTHRATLTLKTYDPVTGVSLKYSTNKAQEVGRLVQIMGRLARPMSGLEDVKMEDAPVGGGEGEGSGAGTPAVESTPAVQGKPVPGGAGGKKKKKGKK